MKIILLSLLVATAAFAQCGSNGTLIINPLTGNWDCTGAAGAGTGTVTSIATTSPITGGTITATGTIACATCVTSSVTQTADRILKGNGSKDTVVSGASIDSNDKGAFPGGMDLGVGSGKTGYELFTGKTSGSVGFTVADTAGTQVLYVVPPIGGGATDDVLSLAASTTCPDMSSGAPSNCRLLKWATPGGGGGGAFSYGAWASLPGTCTTGAAYKGSDSPYLAICTATNTWTKTVFGYTVTEPVLADFTQVAVGLSTLETSHGGILQTVTSAGNAANVQVLAQAIPGSGAYYVDAAFIQLSMATSGMSGTGTSAGTATSNKMAFIAQGFEAGTNWTTQKQYFSNTTSFGSNSGTITLAAVAPMIWVRMYDDRVTNRTFYISTNGYAWQQIYQESRTTDFTPNQAILAISPYNGAQIVHWVHFSIHI